ncbi:MAG TPA: hypothetical protein VMS17_07170 [Gemmataceae bacterium]|nr:hypothetical protein [Gemmataceae bacterium]
MIRTGIAAGIVLLTAAALAPAQTAQGPLRWQAGQVLSYRVEQVVYTSDTVPDGRAESKTKLNLLKRWQVVSVDAAGVATLQLSLGAMRYESTTPTGDALLFDSAAPDKGTPELRAQFSGYLGKALALLRVDSCGRVVEVKDSKFGPPSRFENELPFVGVLPAEGLKAGQEWQRDYKITLEPDKYDAVQKYVCKTAADGAAVTAMTTSLVKLPPASEQPALLDLLPEGEIVYDLKAGRMQKASLKIDKEVKGHQGEGSSYRLQATYTEEFVGDR